MPTRPLRGRPRGPLAALAAALLILSASTPNAAAAQAPAAGDTVPFPKAAFDARVAVADWLARYDRVAWTTSDLVVAEPRKVLERLGPEWFAFEEEGRWHAVYGRYDLAGGRFDPILHYRQAGDAFERTTAPVDSAELGALARALVTTRAALPDTMKPRQVRYNHYVRRLADRRVEVWYLPAGANHVLVTGAEARYVTDASGGRVELSEVTVTGLRGWQSDTTATIRVGDETQDVPTVGHIFFLLQFRPWFGTIYLDSRHHLTTLLETDDGPVWISAVKDRSDAARSR